MAENNAGSDNDGEISLDYQLSDTIENHPDQTSNNILSANPLNQSGVNLAQNKQSVNLAQSVVDPKENPITKQLDNHTTGQKVNNVKAMADNQPSFVKVESQPQTKITPKKLNEQTFCTMFVEGGICIDQTNSLITKPQVEGSLV